MEREGPFAAGATGPVLPPPPSPPLPYSGTGIGEGEAYTAGRRAQHLGLLLCPSAGSMEEAQCQKGRCSGSRLQGKWVKKIPW